MRARDFSPITKSIAVLAIVALTVPPLATGESRHAPSSQTPGAGTATSMPLVIPLFIASQEFASTLVLVNGSAITTYADVVLRDLDGSAIVQRRVVFSPHSQQRLDLGELLGSVAARGEAGSILVMPSSELRGPAIVGSLLMTYLAQPQSNYIDEELAMPSAQGSQILRGVADQGQGSPLLAVASLATTTQHLRIDCLANKGDNFSKSLEIPAGQTVLTESCSNQTIPEDNLQGVFGPGPEGQEDDDESRDSVGIALSSDAMPGSYTAFALVPHRKSGEKFFSAVPFNDPKMAMSATTVFAGVPVGSATLLPAADYVPEVSLANFSKSAAHVKIQYALTSEDTPSVQDVDDLVVPAQSSKHIALRNLQGDPNLTNSFTIVSDGSPGDLAAKLVARSDSQLREVELIGKDLLDTNNAGNHPWSLENGTESTLLLFNDSGKEQYFQVLISSGTVLWQKGYHIASMQTKQISLRDLISNGIKDDSGKTLPSNAADGGVSWYNPNRGTGTGRILQSNRSTAMARNFSCGGGVDICGTAYSGLEELIVNGVPTLFATITAILCLVEPYTCTGTQYTTGYVGYNISWSSANTSIASIYSKSDPNVTVLGNSGGTTQITGYIENPNPPFCSGSGGGPGTVQVPTSLALALAKIVTYNGNNMIECDSTNDGPRWGYSHCATFTLMDQETPARAITSGSFTASETVATVASNPSGLKANVGGGPLTDGSFLDFWAFTAKSAPPPQPGEYVIVKQNITVTNTASGKSYTNIRINCLNYQSTDVTVTDITKSGTCN